MKRRNILLTVLSVITAICAATCLTACFSSETRNDGPTTNTADIVYVSEKDAVITKVNGRDYVKAQDGIAAVGVAYINGYTGPVLVGYDAASVQYTFKYNGTNHVKDYFTVDYNGTTYYYSKNDGFMSGDHRGNCSIYTCAATELEAAALEILGKTEAEKFKLEYNEISTAEQLKAIAGSSERFKLMNTINLGNEDSWTPIENFSGTLFGNGQTINNLIIKNSAEENVGLFGTLQGTVTDLVIKNAQISVENDKGKAGIVAGTNKGIISAVTVNNSCIIEAPNYNNVGGIVGYNDCGTILNCKNEGDVKGANNVGGIAGYVCVNANEIIKGCSNEGTINGTDRVGGIAGFVEPLKKGKNTYTITDNENSGKVTGRDKVGGVFGEASGYYTNSSNYAYFEISSLKNNINALIEGRTSGQYAGGLIGYAEKLNKLTASENHGNVTGGNYVGGFVGKADGTDIQAKDGFENEATITGNGYVGGFAGFAGVIEDAINNGTIISNRIIVENSKSNACVGGIAGWCRGVVNCENKSAIEVTTGGQYVGGLVGFARVYESEKVKESKNSGTITARGSDCVGGIAGCIATDESGKKTFAISDNENEGAITGKNMVGGVFGEVRGYWSSDSKYVYFEMSALTNTAEINGSTTGEYAGGVIGYAIKLTQLTSSKNTADVTGGNYVGGLVGRAYNRNIGTNIKMSAGVENSNTITGNAIVGGIAGQAGIIENAINRGVINSNAIKVYDINDEKNVNGALVGGIAGYCNGVIECENYSNITVTTGGKYVGGIAGYVYMRSEDVKNNKNEGTITATGSDCVGGVAGVVVPHEDGKKTYTLSYNDNIGGVTGANNVGGIFGEVRGYYSNSSNYCYFQVMNCTNTSSQISGTSNVGGIVGYMNRARNDEDVVSNSQNSNTDSYSNTNSSGKKFGNLS